MACRVIKSPKTGNRVKSKLWDSLYHLSNQDEVAADVLYDKVLSDEFIAWFGDWTNKDAENVSKVVDENGEPLIMYHGTDADIISFNYDTVQFTDSTTEWFSGYHFATDKKIADTFGSNTYSVFLNIKKLKKTKDAFHGGMSVEHWHSELASARNLENVDGLTYKNDYEGGTAYVVNYPEQIKSVFNSGKFSISSDSIKDTVPDIEEKLKPFLNDLGISVTTLEEYKDAYKDRIGEELEPKGLADMLHRTIAVNEKTADATTLPEEIAHFAIEASKKDFRFDRALDALETSEFYAGIRDQYLDKYNGNVLKTKKEALGKILADIISGKLERKTIGSRIYNLLTQLFDKFMAKFDSDKRAYVEMKAYLNEIADNVISADMTNFTEELGNEIFYQNAEEAEELDLSPEATLLREAMRTIQQNIQVLNRRDRAGKALKKVKAARSNLYAALREKEYDLGIIQFLDFIKEDSTEVLKFIKKIKKGKANITNRELQYLHDFIKYYDPLIGDAKSAIQQGSIFGNITKKGRKKIIKRIERSHTNFEDILNFYNDLVKERVKGFVKGEADLVGNEIAVEEIDQILEEVDYDSNYIEYFTGSLRDNVDAVAKTVHSAIVRAQNKTHQQTIDFGRDLLKKGQELGITKTDFMLEIEDGKATGAFLDKYRWGAFEQAMQEFAKEVHEKFGLSEDPEIRREQKFFGMGAREKRDYAKLWAEWFSENATEVDNAAAIIKERSEEMTDDEFAVWKESNIGESAVSGREYFKIGGELSRPSDKWINPNYSKLDAKQTEYLEHVKALKKAIDDNLPRAINSRMMPQIRASLVDVLFGKDRSLRKIGSVIRDDYQRAEDDTEFGDVHVAIRPDGSQIRFVPIYYVRQLDDTNLITTDVVSSMVLYQKMAKNFENMARIAPTVELAQEQIGKRNYRGKRKAMSGTETNVYKAVDKFLDMQLYGKTKQDLEANIPLLGKVSVSKMLTQVNSYIRANNLAWNLFTTVAGHLTGASFSKVEDFVGKYTTHSSKLRAIKEWTSNAHMALLEMGKPLKTNKMHLIFEDHKVVSGYDMFDNLDKSRLTRKAISSGLYWSYEMVDYSLRGKLGIAVMDNFRYDPSTKRFYNLEQFMSGIAKKDTEKKKKRKEAWDKLDNYYDMWEYDTVNKNRVKLKNKFKDIVTEDVKNLVTTRIEFLATKVDGQLADTDKAAIHQGAWTQLVATHRGWLFSGVQARLKQKGFNYQTGMMEEGYYRTMGRFLSDTVLKPSRVRGVKEMLARFDSLDKHEKRAVQRFLYEAALIVAVATIAKIINHLATEDEEDPWLLEYAAYQSNRVLLETAVFMPPAVLFEGTAILNSPVAASRQLDVLADLAHLFSNEEVKTGMYKGLSKRERFLIKLTPIVKSTYSVRDPKSLNQFLKYKPLDWIY